jgi:hypothetical protein
LRIFAEKRTALKRETRREHAPSLNNISAPAVHHTNNTKNAEISSGRKVRAPALLGIRLEHFPKARRRAELTFNIIVSIVSSLSKQQHLSNREK